MKPQTTQFVDREQALSAFEQMLTTRTQRALAFQAPDGLGKSYLLREFRLMCESAQVETFFVNASHYNMPSHWHILRQMINQWRPAMNRTAQALDWAESQGVSLERLPGGAVFINAQNLTVLGDVIGGQKIGQASDAQAREYRGLNARIEQAFLHDLSEMCRAASEQAVHPSIERILIFDDIDQVTEETLMWLARILRQMWAGDFPGLKVVVAGVDIPRNLLRSATDSMSQLTLELFRLEDVADYCGRIGLPETEAPNIFIYSGGNPKYLDVITRNALSSKAVIHGST